MESNKGNGRLAGKVAIVTGGGAREGTELGTGRATSVALAREGARVLVADLHADNAERTVAEIRAAGGEASAFAADVSKSEQCAAMVAAAVERYGDLHVLVNNCGTGASGTVSGLDEATLERSLDVNLKSAIYSSKHAIPHMAAAGGGSIINVSSIDGLTAGMAVNVPYGIAKGALHMLTKTTAVYHGREGIRANCIAPGHLHAAFTGHMSGAHPRPAPARRPARHRGHRVGHRLGGGVSGQRRSALDIGRGATGGRRPARRGAAHRLRLHRGRQVPLV